MRAGLEWDEQSRSFRDPENDLVAWLNLTRRTTDDPIRAVLERPMVAAPGTLFNYSGGSYWEAPLLSPHQMMTGYVLPSIVG